MIAVPGGNVWFARVGGGTGLPLLAVHGGPGLPHDYMISLRRLADEREVIFWDQLGCGRSERPSATQLWTMERAVAEMDAVVKALGLNRFHIFGNSWGGMLAQQYALDVPSGAASLTISNSFASIPEFSKTVARLKSELDPATQSAIDRHEAAGTLYAPEYRAAIRTWNETHLCRVRPWPPELEGAFRTMNNELYRTMFGPSNFRIVGTIRGWDVLDRLVKIAVPTLILAARYDECVPEHMWEMHTRIPDSRFELFESTAHMPFIEEPEKFDRVMRDFLAAHDAARA
ncbi:proline iminopeptidase-family hydrolase [Mycobacterium palustre]|nr:proline iminopeptidase-family hydrolase [Mycobacterium palustre]MCV7103745.1 proline iminopeptidase-family hydrolase [Mycobacterium palustre]